MSTTHTDLQARQVVEIIQGRFRNSPNYSKFYKKTDSGEEEVSFENNNIIGTLDIRGLRFGNSIPCITFQGCNLSILEINHSDIKVLTISNSSKLENLNVTESKINNFQIENVELNNISYSTSTTTFLQIHSTKFKKFTTSGRSRIDTCKIINSEFVDIGSADGTTIGTLELKSSGASVNIRSVLESAIFQDCIIEDLKFSGKINLQSINCSNSEFTNISFSDQVVLKSFLFTKSKVDVFNIVTLNIDRLIFESSNFIAPILLTYATVASFIVINSKLNDIELNNCNISKLEITQKSKCEDLNLTNNCNILNILISDKVELKDIFIANSTLGSLIILNTSKIANLNINDVSQLKQVLIASKSSTNDISIYTDSKIQDFFLEDCKVNNIGINAASVVELSISKQSKVNNLNFFNSKIIRNFTLTDKSESKNIGINGVDIKGDFKVDNSNVGDVTLFDSHIGGNINLGNESIAGKIYIYNTEVDRDIDFYQLTTSELEFGNITNVRRINISGGVIGSLKGGFKKTLFIDFKSVIIEHLNFTNFTIPKDSVLLLNDCIINCIEFNSTLNFGNLQFKNITQTNDVTDWQLLRSDKNKLLKGKINSIPKKVVESRLLFINSDLGKTIFIGSNLFSFDRFQFFNSKFLEIFIAGTRFPEEIEVPENYTSKLLEQQRLAYGQFKKIFELRGDNVTALDYKAQELEVYRKQLIIEGRKKNWVELINLGFQKCTSNYGTNWWKALLISKALLFGGFAIYCMFMGNLFSFNGSCSLFLHNFSYIGGFLSPVHKNETLESSIRQLDEMSNWVSAARIWGDVVRLFLAIMLFQTIQAFRKHSKSTN